MIIRIYDGYSLKMTFSVQYSRALLLQSLPLAVSIE